MVGFQDFPGTDEKAFLETSHPLGVTGLILCLCNYRKLFQSD